MKVIKSIIILTIFILIMFSGILHAESPFRCDYVITSEFGSMIGFGGERRPYGHEGADLWCPDYIISPIAPGVIKEIGQDDIYGKFVIVSHDGFESLYAHAETIFSATALPGMVVTTDTPIIRMGMTGFADKPHLHLEVIENGIPVNPMKYLVEKGEKK